MSVNIPRCYTSTDNIERSDKRQSSTTIIYSRYIFLFFFFLQSFSCYFIWNLTKKNHKICLYPKMRLSYLAHTDTYDSLITVCNTVKTFSSTGWRVLVYYYILYEHERNRVVPYSNVLCTNDLWYRNGLRINVRWLIVTSYVYVHSE